jgi:hypothetical protein
VPRDRDLHVEVDGIPHVLACCAALDHTVDERFDEVITDTAQTVAQRTRALMPVGPMAHGHARSSVDVVRTEGLSATVTEGGARFPYVGWLEFGGWVGWRGIPHRNHREWIPRGRYLFPTLSTVKPGIEPRMHEALRTAARQAGWDPDG